MKNTQIIGISWMIFHCLMISSVVVIAKLLGKMGYSSIQIVFFHSFVAFLLILPFGIKKHGKDLIKTKKINLHLLRSSFGVVSMLLYFTALKYVNLNDARAVALFNPVITFIFGIIFIKEHINNKKITALILSLIGGFIIINPTSPTFNIALLLVMMAMIMWSAMDLVIKEISKTEPTIKQLFFLTGFLSLFSLLPTIYFWKAPSGIHEILLLIFIGVLFLFNSLSIFFAIKYANLTTIMPFDFSGVVFTAIISYAVFREVISLNTFMGAIIVFASSLYLIHHENKSGKELAKISRTNIEKE